MSGFGSRIHIAGNHPRAARPIAPRRALAAAGGALALLAAGSPWSGPASANPFPACPAGWDATADFSATNPSPDNCVPVHPSVWSYRYGPSWNVATTQLPFYTTTAGLGETYWQMSSTSYGLPSIGKNATGNTLYGYWPTNTLVMHPDANRIAQLRWVSPIPVKACINVSLRDLDSSSGDGVRVHLRRTTGGPALWNVAIPNGGGPVTYAVTSANHMGFSPGQGLNLSVDSGAAHNYLADAIAVTETIISC